jgi:hypothetical protein
MGRTDAADLLPRTLELLILKALGPGVQARVRHRATHPGRLGGRAPGGRELAAATILALGIGANATVFAIISAMAFRDLPVEEPNRILSLQNGDRPPLVLTVAIGGRYFETLGLRLRRGRTFSDSDGAPAREAAIVNERFVAVHLGGGDPIGKRIRLIDETPSEDGAAWPA